MFNWISTNTPDDPDPIETLDVKINQVEFNLERKVNKIDAELRKAITDTVLDLSEVENRHTKQICFLFLLIIILFVGMIL